MNGHVRDTDDFSDLALGHVRGHKLQNLLPYLVQLAPVAVQRRPDDGAFLGVIVPALHHRLQIARRVALAVVDLPVIRRAVFGVLIVNRRDARPCRIVDDGHQADGALALRGPLFIGGR